MCVRVYVVNYINTTSSLNIIGHIQYVRTSNLRRTCRRVVHKQIS